MAERKSFGQLRNVLEMPDLISLQVDSYDNFLQRYVPPAERKRQGLQEVFMEIFPKFSGKKINAAPFPRIPFRESMQKYG